MRALLIPNRAMDLITVGRAIEDIGFQIEVAESQDEGVDLAKRYDWDLVALANTDTLARIRAAKVRAPVLAFTSDASSAARCRLLDGGADDVLAEACPDVELTSRVRALVRRSRGHASNIIAVGDLSVLIEARIATVAGVPVHLTGKEYAILEVLALRKGALVTKEGFLDHLYGGMDEPELKIIDVFVCKLRKKLEHAHGVYIQTVWSRGYRLIDASPEKTVASHKLVTISANTLLVRILEKLSAGEATASRIAAHLQRHPSNIRPPLDALCKRDLAHRRGRGGRRDPYVYVIADTGREWLARNGFAPSEVAA